MHMAYLHKEKNRLIPPRGFVELHVRRARMAAAAVVELRDTAPTEAAHGAGGSSGVGSSPWLGGTSSGTDGRRADEGAGTRAMPTQTLSSCLPVVNFSVGVGGRALSDADVPPVSAADYCLDSGGFAFCGGVGSLRVPVDGFARGTLAVPRPRHAFQASTTARIRAYYAGMPEASQSRRLAPVRLGTLPSLFNTRTLQEVLRFALTSGGPGLAESHQKRYWSSLTAVERDACPSAPQRRTRSRATAAHGESYANGNIAAATTGTGTDKNETRTGDVPFQTKFPSAYSFVAAIKAEQRRVLSKLQWDVTPIEVEGVTFLFYSRDLLHVVLEELRGATNVQLWGEALGSGADGTRLRSGAMNSDIFLGEQANLQRRRGDHCFVVGIYMFIDEAVVSWSGAHYIYPIRVLVLNVLDGGSRWVTVGYIPHVPKSVGRTAAAKRIASDSRNALLQRCLAVLLRRVYEASDTGVAMDMPDGKPVRAFPRIIGLVADQLGERAAMCLMGNACTYFCSHCMVRRDAAGRREGLGAEPRDVTAVVDAQAAGAVARDRDPRPSLRNQLRTEYSALAFVPAIAGVWGLATDDRRLYDIICFDMLHVWKLGIVRMVAQRIPAFLVAACAGTGGQARLGPVTDTLEAINLRAWELGHLCVPAPTPPGYACFSLSLVFRGTLVMGDLCGGVGGVSPQVADSLWCWLFSLLARV